MPESESFPMRVAYSVLSLPRGKPWWPWLLGMREASLSLLPDSSHPGDLTGDARVVRGGRGLVLNFLRTIRMVEWWFLSSVVSPANSSCGFRAGTMDQLDRVS